MNNNRSIADALRARYPSPAFALFFEVPDATAMRHSRTADAIAVGCWPSRGMSITGIEIKRARYDWQRELKNPQKAETLFRYCDFWFLCVSDASIVKSSELPKQWGLLVQDGNGKLTVAVDAPKLSPIPMDIGFVASICRRAATDSVDAARLKSEYDRGWLEAMKKSETTSDLVVKRLTEQFKKLQERVAAFEKASGVSLGEWSCRDPQRLGRVVRDLLNTDDGKLKELERLKFSAEAIAAHIQDQIECIADVCESTTEGPDAVPPTS